MTHRLESITRYFPHPEWLLNFIDNHDGARFLTRTSHASFRQALLFIMTIPGVPVVYYGTEQELLGMRQAMFKGGAGSPDQDHFITDSESFTFLQELISLRKESEIFRRGMLTVLRDDTGGPGIFAYRLDHGNDFTIILLNTSEKEKYADNVPTGLEPGAVLECGYALSGSGAEQVTDDNGNMHVLLKPKEGMILRPAGRNEPLSTGDARVSILPLGGQVQSGAILSIQGRSEGVKQLFVMIDGDYQRRVKVDPGAEGAWIAQIPLGHLMNGTHRVTAVSNEQEPGGATVSDHIRIEVKHPEELMAYSRDETGDDHGPLGSYSYPSHPSYRAQMDIESVRVYRMGQNLKIEVTMSEITQIWIPPNEFDHALINIFIDVPDRDGVEALPLQNATMPPGSAWNYTVSTAGFGNAIFSSDGADENNTGDPTGPSASVFANPGNRSITFIVSSEALGYPSSLEGAKLYLTTWDGGPGSPRSLNRESGLWSFSGGSDSDPRIMDDTELIILNDIR